MILKSLWEIFDFDWHPRHIFPRGCWAAGSATHKRDKKGLSNQNFHGIFVVKSILTIRDVKFFLEKDTWRHSSAGLYWVGPQTHLVPWIFWSPRNLVPEKFGPQKFGPHTFLVPKKFGPQEIWSPRNLVPEKFGPQEIWSPGNLVPKKFGPQEIWSPGNLVPKKFGPQEEWSPKKFAKYERNVIRIKLWEHLYCHRVKT